MELDELLLQDVDKARSLPIAQPKHCVSLELRNAQAAWRTSAERAEEFREDLARVLELGGGDELAVARNVADDDEAALDCHPAIIGAAVQASAGRLLPEAVLPRSEPATAR